VRPSHHGDMPGSSSRAPSIWTSFKSIAVSAAKTVSKRAFQLICFTDDLDAAGIAKLGRPCNLPVLRTFWRHR